MSSSSATNEEPEVCGICMEPLYDERPIETLHNASQSHTALTVAHRFHRECISRWLTQEITNQGGDNFWSGNMRCPICNETVSGQDLSKLPESVFPSLVISGGIVAGIFAGTVTITSSMMQTIMKSWYIYNKYNDLVNKIQAKRLDRYYNSLTPEDQAEVSSNGIHFNMSHPHMRFLGHTCNSSIAPLGGDHPFGPSCATEGWIQKTASEHLRIGLNESLLLAACIALYTILLIIVISNMFRIMRDRKRERRFGGDPTNSNELCIKNQYINMCVTIPKEMMDMVNAAIVTLKEFEEHYHTISTKIKGGRKTYKKYNIVKKRVKKTRKN
jgi:hypothetical protein